MIGYIYKLHCPETNLIYIGSTAMPLHKRLCLHKTKKDNTTTSRTLFEQSDNVQIELIEEFEFDDKKELERREGEIIKENIDICLNKRVAGRTTKEWMLDNNYDNAAMCKKYREKNLEEIKAQQKEYHAKNRDWRNATSRERNSVMYKCECGETLRKDSKYKHEKRKKHLAYEENKN